MNRPAAAVAVCASATVVAFAAPLLAQPPPGSSGTKAMQARAHQLVTVPRSIKWDQPEVGR